MNVSLPKDLKDWIDDQVETGGFGTASEYLRDMLRRARDRQIRREIDLKLVEAVEDKTRILLDNARWASIRAAGKAAAAKSMRKKR